MKIKLVCDESKYTTIKEKLISSGYEVCDEDAEWILKEIYIKDDEIKIKISDGYKILKLDDIVAVESFDHTIYIYDFDSEYKVRKPLKEIEYELSSNFIRISKSVIINKKKINHISTFTGQKFRVMMINHKKFIVTKSYYHNFIKEMEL